MAASLLPATQITPQVMESVLLEGDLSRLQPADRVQYYRCVCESVGLNPLTRPLEYLRLNGKLTLYAKRDCTDQLRRIHRVSITIANREVVEGCYIVTARAELPGGRLDESIGAVPIDGLKGEARSNALMKCETKAKRRVTLAICGLAFLDESERESVAGAVPVTVADDGSIIAGTVEAAQEVARRKIAIMSAPAAAPTAEKAASEFYAPQLSAPQPAVEIAERIPEEWEPPAEDISELEQQLHDSIVQVERMKAPPKRCAGRYDMLRAFRELKKRYEAIGCLKTYYGYLALHGLEHSDGFADTPEGLSDARCCYKELSLWIANREVRA